MKAVGCRVKADIKCGFTASTETQTLTVVVEDNFGKSYEMEFSFNDTDEEEEFARSANKLGSV